MLYFSKLRIFSVLIFTLILTYFSISNFTKLDDDLFSKNIKLGLDLQGGSYFCLLYTSPSPRDVEESRMPSSA